MSRLVYVTVPASWSVVSAMAIGDTIGAGTRLRTPAEFDAIVLRMGSSARAADGEPYLELAVEVGDAVSLSLAAQAIADWLWDHWSVLPDLDFALDDAMIPTIPSEARVSIHRTVVQLTDERRAKRTIRELIDRPDDEFGQPRAPLP